MARSTVEVKVSILTDLDPHEHSLVMEALRFYRDNGSHRTAMEESIVSDIVIEMDRAEGRAAHKMDELRDLNNDF